MTAVERQCMQASWLSCGMVVDTARASSLDGRAHGTPNANRSIPKSILSDTVISVGTLLSSA